MAWVPVSEDDARLHPCYGFGGWLWLVYAVEVAGFAMTLDSVVRIVRLSGAGALASPSLAVIWLHLALALPFLVMAPARARAMPAVSIACYWTGVLASLCSFVLYGLPPMAVPILAPMLFWWAWGVFFTVYLLRARRVNVTYRHRVREGEAAALSPAAGTA